MVRYRLYFTLVAPVTVAKHGKSDVILLQAWLPEMRQDGTEHR